MHQIAGRQLRRHTPSVEELELAFASEVATVVAARGLTRDYGTRETVVHALRDVDIDIAQGRLTAIMGPSGSGKSTLMHVLAGLDRPTGGSASIDGVEITRLKEKELTQLRRDKIGFIFQSFNLLATLTADENIVLPMSLARRRADETWRRTVIEAVGLQDRLTHRPAELSGGQQQRVAVARALITRPAVLFADEPTGNLDSRTGGEVLDLLRRSVEEFRQTVIMVTHDAGAASIADRIVFLKDGRIVLDRERMTRDEIYDTIKNLEERTEDEFASALAGADEKRTMTRLAFRSLASRPLRTILTTLAILLGVAMITGTYVLTDQVDRGFAQIFETSFKGTAVVVEQKTSFTDIENMEPRAMDAGLIDAVAAVPGVSSVAGAYETMGAAIVDGETIQTGGAPTLLTAERGEPFDQGRIVEGREAQERNEVTIIKSFADEAGLRPGESFAVAAPSGLEQVSVVGVFEWGEAGSLGGTIVIAGRLEDVQRWGGEPGAVTSIDVSADPGTSPDELAARVRDALPAAVSVKTGEQAAAEATAETADAIGSFLTPVLLAFAGVSVFVGAFIIFNAFSITVAQRRREFAMLRALGASRRQVLTSVVAEALTLGVLASAVGIVAGLGVAKGINALFKAVGADMPTSGIVLEPRTVLIAVLVGVGVTLLSALAPALRATRVPPVAALQEGATLPPTRFSKFSTSIALAFAALGGGSLAYGILSDGGTNDRLLLMGLGALLLFVAIAMLAKYVVRPASRVIGWPLERLAPISGRLARDNAGRNPSRTAATAAALMIGLTMVVFVAVFAQGLKDSFGGAITDSTRADLVAQDRSAFLTVPQTTVAELQQVPGVEAAAGVAWAPLEVKGGGVVTANAVDPTVWTEVWGPDWRRGGGDALYAKLDASHVILEDGSPIAGKVEAGDSITVTSQSGKTAELTVLGFYRDQMAYSGMMLSLDTLEKLDVPTAAGMTLVRTDGSADTQAAVQKALAQYPTQKVETKAEYLDAINKQVDQILMMFYGLLAMSVIISIFGIVNTLVLSVHERTREIGMLRAIGATRRQLRQMVRYESVITAVIGGVLGTLVGVAMAYVIVTQMGEGNLVFSLPWLQLGVFLALAVVVGVVAAVLPARRAAGTRILEAIQYE